MMTDIELKKWLSSDSPLDDVEKFFINPCDVQFPDNSTKSRVYWFILYPEHYNNKNDMLNRLINLAVPFILSPLHDKDKYSDDVNSDVKKAHYHLILCFKSPTTPKKVKELLLAGGIEWGFGLGTNEITSDNIVGEKYGAIKYVIHSGWDDKYQYSSDDMIFFNEDKQDLLLNTYTETEAFQLITDIIDKNKFVEYLDLIHYLEDNNTTLLLYTIKKLGAPVTAYLKSLKRTQDKAFYNSHIISEDLR